MDFQIREANTSTDRERADALLQEVGARGDAPPLRSTSDGNPQQGYILRYWLLGDGDNKVHGTAVLLRQPWRPDNVFSLQVGVAPERRRTGLGSALYQAALAAAHSHHAQRLLAEVDGNDTDALGFVTRRGFTITQQFRTMTLDIPTFPLARFTTEVAHATTQAGVRIFSFAEAGDTPENRLRLYTLNKRLAPDLPGNGDEFPTFDEYTHEILEADWFRPEGQFIAAITSQGGEHWVGLVGIGFDPERNVASHEFTAVDREFRGRGIAQALKVRSIGYAAALGASTLITGNDSLNAAMLAINRKLGYREHLGATRLELPL